MVKYKQVISNEEAKNKLLLGSKILSDAVSSTLGPWGKNVALARRYNPPHVTKDGVTVANEIVVEDFVQNVAVSIIKEAARKTAQDAGDGTSSTVLFASNIVKEGFSLIEKYGLREVSLAFYNAIEMLLQVLFNNLTNKVEVKDLYNIAIVAANGDEKIAKLVSEAFSEIGINGHVSVKKANAYESKIDVTSGIRIEKSFADSLMHNKDGSSTTLDRCNILVTDLKIVDHKDIYKLLEITNGEPLFVICDDINDVALETVMYARSKGAPLYIIRAPFIAEARRETLKDIALATGSTFISVKESWEVADITSSVFGNADIEVDQEQTIIRPISNDKELLKERVEYYEKKIEEDTIGVSPNYKKRLAMLTAGNAIIYVGGASDVDIKEKKDRVDDTVCAVRSALKKGSCKGGGLTYSELAKHLESSFNEETSHVRKDCFLLIAKSLRSILNKIASNGGIPMSTFIVSIENNVIDPSYVIEGVIRNGITAALSLISISNVIIDTELEDKSNPLLYAR